MSEPEETDPLRHWFERYCDVPSVERKAWLSAQQLPPDLHSELQALIASAERQGYLDRHVGEWFLSLEQDDDEPSADRMLGQIIGDYRLVRLIGSGGMGTVYLGERVAGDFQQQAAIKLFDRPWYSRQQVELFRRERQILASLSHPHIAHLLDAGIAENNIAFLVMEYVEGNTIVEHCRDAALSVVERLKLVQQVCFAVASAHAHLVVHRDIKPANVMVNASGEVKLLDFGIAKLLDQETQTATGKALMTYAYAAPEQRQGGHITTATDVYALGVLMQELLLGKHNESTTGTVRPSQLAVSRTDAQFHSGELPAKPKQLAKMLRGDIDTMLQQAMAAEPERRYASAQAMAEDIGRYLSGQAVLAHPPSGWYLTRKFIARNRGGVALTALLGLGMVASLILALLQSVRTTQAAARATEQSKRAEVVRDFLIDVMSAAADDLPRDQRPTPAQLASTAQAQLTSDVTLAPDIRLDLLLTFAEINLSQREFAATVKNLEQAKLLLDSELGDAKLRWLRLDAERLIIDGHAEQAAAVLQPFKGEMIEMNSEHSVRTLQVLAWAESEQSHNAEALELEELIAKRFGELLGPDHPRTLKSRMDLGLSYTNLGRWVDADQALTPLFAHWRELKLPPDAEYTEALAGLGYAKVFQAKFDEARTIFEQTLTLRREIYDSPHDRIAHSLSALGIVELTSGRYPQAVKYRAEALAIELAILKEGHPVLIATRAQLANAEISLGSLAQAERTLAPAVAACNGGSGSPLYCEMQNSVRTRLLLEQGRLQQAKVSALSGIELSIKARGKNSARLADPYGLLANVHAELGSEVPARAAMTEALRLTGGSGLTWQKLRVVNVQILAKFEHDSEVFQETEDLLITKPELVVNPHDQAQLWIQRIEAMQRLKLNQGLPAARANLANIAAPYLPARWQARRKQALAAGE